MTRRANNEGSIYKRKDGRWAASITLPSGGRRTVYGRTRQAVGEALIVALRDKQQGIMPSGDARQTLGQFLDTWLRESVKPTVRPRTFESYAERVRLHIAPGLGGKRLVGLSPPEIQAFLNKKLANGLSPRSVQYLHAVLRRALGQALKWGLVPRNAAKLVDPPRVPRHEIKPLAPEQARAFLRAAGKDRFSALYTVAVALGLRLGEIVALRWTDIDVERASLSVNGSLQRISGQLVFVEPKTARSRRTIALPSFAIAALREHRVRQREERLRAGSSWRDTGLVFTTPIGTPVDRHNLGRRFKALLAETGLPIIRFHDLRHTAASLLLAQGVAARTIMDTLGHSQISLTMNTYAHVMPELQRDAAAKMDAILAGVTAT